MLDFILSAETACDMSEKQAKENGISIMPMKFYVDGEEYSSSEGKITLTGLCEKMRAGSQTKTTQPNDYEAEEYFKELMKSGKDILHISFSGGQSGTAETMRKAAEKLNDGYAAKIYVVDSLCQSAGVSLLLYMVKDMAEKENFTAEQAAQYAESEKMGIAHCFVVDSLTYLARGGRISQKSAFIGNLINIKPVMHLNDEGKIVLIQKVLGRNRSLKNVVTRFRENYNGKFDTVFITHADCLKDAEFVAAEIKKINPALKVIVNELGNVITCHSGPGTMAVYFTTDSRKEV